MSDPLLQFKTIFKNPLHVHVVFVIPWPNTISVNLNRMPSGFFLAGFLMIQIQSNIAGNPGVR